MVKNKKIFKLGFNILYWKQGKVWIAYLKQYDLCGYGDTIKEAEELLETQIREILFYSKPKKFKS